MSPFTQRQQAPFCSLGSWIAATPSRFELAGEHFRHHFDDQLRFGPQAKNKTKKLIYNLQLNRNTFHFIVRNVLVNILLRERGREKERDRGRERKRERGKKDRRREEKRETE